MFVPYKCLDLQRNTKKFSQIIKSNKVALLIHDFPNLKEPTTTSSAPGQRRTFSITLNGTANVCTGEISERYRKIHLNANPAYRNFIHPEGDGPLPMVLCVNIESARICDIKDKVQHWDVLSAAKEFKANS